MDKLEEFLAIPFTGRVIETLQEAINLKEIGDHQKLRDIVINYMEKHVTKLSNHFLSMIETTGDPVILLQMLILSKEEYDIKFYKNIYGVTLHEIENLSDKSIILKVAQCGYRYYSCILKNEKFVLGENVVETEESSMPKIQCFFISGICYFTFNFSLNDDECDDIDTDEVFNVYQSFTKRFGEKSIIDNDSLENFNGLPWENFERRVDFKIYKDEFNAFYRRAECCMKSEKGIPRGNVLIAFPIDVFAKNLINLSTFWLAMDNIGDFENKVSSYTIMNFVCMVMNKYGQKFSDLKRNIIRAIMMLDASLVLYSQIDTDSLDNMEYEKNTRKMFCAALALIKELTNDFRVLPATIIELSCLVSHGMNVDDFAEYMDILYENIKNIENENCNEGEDEEMDIMAPIVSDTLYEITKMSDCSVIWPSFFTLSFDVVEARMFMGYKTDSVNYLIRKIVDKNIKEFDDIIKTEQLGLYDKWIDNSSSAFITITNFLRNVSLVNVTSDKTMNAKLTLDSDTIRLVSSFFYAVSSELSKDRFNLGPISIDKILVKDGEEEKFVNKVDAKVIYDLHGLEAIDSERIKNVIQIDAIDTDYDDEIIPNVMFDIDIAQNIDEDDARRAEEELVQKEKKDNKIQELLNIEKTGKEIKESIATIRTSGDDYKEGVNKEKFEKITTEEKVDNSVIEAEKKIMNSNTENYVYKNFKERNSSPELRYEGFYDSPATTRDPSPIQEFPSKPNSIPPDSMFRGVFDVWCSDSDEEFFDSSSDYEIIEEEEEIKEEQQTIKVEEEKKDPPQFLSNSDEEEYDELSSANILEMLKEIPFEMITDFHVTPQKLKEMVENTENVKKLHEKAEKQGSEKNEENTYYTNNGKEEHHLISSDDDGEEDFNYDPTDF